MKFHSKLAFAAFASASVAIWAQPVAGIYSDIRQADEGHWGAEVVISSSSSSRNWAVVRCANNEVGERVRLRAIFKENRIEIAGDPSGRSLCPDGKFVGTFADSGISGQFQDLSQLPSSWHVHKLRRRAAIRQ